MIWIAALALTVTTCSKQAESWKPAGHAAVAAAPAAPVRNYRRVEDLPIEPVRRVEDLPLAPPAPVRALRPDEVTPALLLVADDLLWNADPPLGTEVPIELDNQVYVARLELHFHPVGGPKRPWGRHKGVTLYATE